MTRSPVAAAKEQKAEITFQTSMYGAVSKIPASYTVEIREVLVGTKFIVDERNYETRRSNLLAVFINSLNILTKRERVKIRSKNVRVEVKNYIEHLNDIVFLFKKIF